MRGTSKAPSVKVFIEMHGGRIEIESEVAEGATVSLFFPSERTDIF